MDEIRGLLEELSEAYQEAVANSDRLMKVVAHLNELGVDPTIVTEVHLNVQLDQPIQKRQQVVRRMDHNTAPLDGLTAARSTSDVEFDKFMKGIWSSK
jgi:hypothetical protein